MARKSTEELGINMTPMIDVVFQLMIFFLVTAKMDSETRDDRIRLAESPSGPAIEQKDPRTIVVEVNEKGRITISRTGLSPEVLTKILRQAVGQYGANVPVQVAADRRAKHESVRLVMDACARAGIWRISFVATKETAEQGQRRMRR